MLFVARFPHLSSAVRRISGRAGACLLLAAFAAPSAHPQNPGDHAELSPAGWVEAASQNEVRIINDDGTFPVRYRIHKIDSKTDIVRDVIECREGTVARLIERNGQPLTRDEDDAERKRLEAILADPSDFFKHQKRNQSARGYATSLIQLMPKAMLYTYAPGQPQAPNAHGPQVVVDFVPDPNFQPPTTVSQILTGLAGRMWIDKRTLHLTRIEGRVIKPVNFGWGVLAHVFPGGTVEFEQADAGDGRWIYSHVDENITLREMMVHTAVEKNRMTATDIHLLPAPISYKDAIHELLAEQIALR